MATRKDIKSFRKGCEASGYEFMHVQHGNACFSCVILPPDKCPELPNFAMQMVADDMTKEETYKKPDEIAIFGVSAEVPVHFRKLVVGHEMIEYIEGKECIDAMASELLSIAGVLTKDQYADYVRMRTKLFRALPTYCRDKNYPEKKVNEFIRTALMFSAMTELLA